MKKFFLILLPFFLCLELSAVNVEWIGGSGNWNVGSNWSTGSIPTINDNVFINTGSPTIPSWHNARTRGVYVGPNATVTINQNGKLRSIGANNTSGIVNDGTIYNSGLIQVREHNSTLGIDIFSGLENHGTLINQYRGKIKIKQIEGTGIYNFSAATFANSGEIEMIEDIEGEGLINDNDFYNYGSITISNTLQTSILNYGTLINESSYISISNSDMLGFENHGDFENTFKSTLIITNNYDRGYMGYYTSSIYNDGEIFIDNIWGFGATAFMTNGDFENDINGEIVTELSSSGIYLSAESTNRGVMEAKNSISEIGFMVQDHFINYSQGTILVNECGFRNIYSSTGGVFDNYGYIKTSDAPVGVGIAVHGVFTNHIGGEIDVLRALNGIINFNIFDNYGTINSGHDASVNAIVDNANFTNYAQGFILIHDYPQTGIHIQDGANTINYGMIEIDSDQGQTGMYIQGNFTNSPNAEIQIVDTQIEGIFLQSSGHLINQGHLEISTEGIADAIEAYGTVVNELDAYLYIYGLTGNGSSIRVNSSGEFINKDNARINLTSTFSNYNNGIYNSGSFENNDCASITYLQRINNSGVFINNAWMEDHYPFTHTNTGDLLNFAIIQDHDPSFQNINAENNGVIIESIQGPVNAGDVIEEALNIGPDTEDYVKTKVWFTDPNGNDFAGYYDMEDNVFYSENNTEGFSTLYVRIDNTIGGCNGFIPIPIIGGIHLTEAPNSTHAKQARHDANQSEALSSSLVYPNPNPGTFQLQGDFSGGDYTVLLYNQLGQKVWSKQLFLDQTPTEIQIGNTLPDGLYLLKVKSEKKNITSKKVQIQNIR
jgi:hypothetical protein